MDLDELVQEQTEIVMKYCFKNKIMEFTPRSLPSERPADISEHDEYINGRNINPYRQESDPIAHRVLGFGKVFFNVVWYQGQDSKIMISAEELEHELVTLGDLAVRHYIDNSISDVNVRDIGGRYTILEGYDIKPLLIAMGTYADAVQRGVLDSYSRESKHALNELKDERNWTILDVD